ncbi:hypothetical protein RMCBS344292_15655 [Rhizopus microsporus]|nr:hypothetical protein RMCBS344292_15655 [Rhizopus microsporus]
MSYIKCPLAVDRGFPSLFAQTQTSLFKTTAFEASDDDFQEIQLLKKDKNIRTTLKAVKDTSAAGPSNVVINEKTSIPIVNKDTSVQAVLPAPTPSTSSTSAPIKTSEQKQVRCPSCGGADHSRSSSKLCPMNKAKTKSPKPKDTVEKTFVIKTSLANTCKYPKFVTLVQVVDHITQLVYAGSIFANYYFLKLLENGEELPTITQNLFYNIFSIFAGQGKHASDSIKKSFKTFCESTSLTQSDLDKDASKGYMTIVSSMAKQYETLVRNYVCSTYEDRTLRHNLNVLSEKASPYFCGDSLTVKQRKSLAKHMFQQKINPKSAWPSTVDRIERYETIVNSFLRFWSTYDVSNDADVPSEANMYAKPQCYMKWLHFIQKEMEQKKFIQEMKPQDKASSSYVHRKLQELPFVKKLNISKYRSLKENTLTAINSNKTLEITSKLKNIDKKDIDAAQSFIKTVQARIQDKTFMPLKYTDSRGSRYFSLLPLYKIDSKSIQIDAQSFWKLAKQCDNNIKSGQKNDNDLTLWYFNVFDFSKIGYKTLESLTSRSKEFANVITTDGYAVSFMFKKTVSIQGEYKREPKTPKNFVDIVDDAEIWAVDLGISTIFTAVDSTEHERVRTTSLEEYYHLCGYNLATRRRKEHQECHLEEFKYISELPTLKTANLTSFLLAASTRLQNYQRIHNYYCQDKWYVALLHGVYFNNAAYGIGLKS